LDADPSTLIILFFLLLILSAFFSGSETAYFSINSIILEKLNGQKSRKARRVVRLLSHPRRLLITILIGNTLVNVAAASIATILTMQFCIRIGILESVGVVINIVIVTFLILVLSEISPKIFAVRNSEKFAKNVSLFVLGFYYLFSPFTVIIDKSISFLTGIFNVKEADEDRLLHTNEFQALLELGEEQGELEEEEKEMIHSIFEFGDTVVREIMVPRTDMVCVSSDTSIDELVSIIKEKGHTRIPVYQESIDKIEGIINAKDLIPLISNSKKDFDLLKLARPAIFVPESKKIDDLLRLFQKKRQHMAVVVDEYGGTAGLVTLEDVIEEIVGEIRDEYDQEEQLLFRKLEENVFLVNAKIDIESLNELINIDIPTGEDYDTLGGFILELTGSVPQKNEVIRYGDYELIVQEVVHNRIIQVKIVFKPEEKQEEE